jgi:sugar lactone lactonase YvrE
MTVPACIVPAGDRCGEGPVWHAAEQALYWTDINRFLVHRFDLRDGSAKFWFFDEPVTALALTDSNSVLLVALGSQLILWNPRSDSRSDFGFHLPDWPRVRLNDGRADPRGAFWVGSMRNNVNPDGSPGEAGGSDGILFCVHPTGEAKEWKRGIGISNTVAWAPDASRFYFGDTLANAIYVYDFDLAAGTIANERLFFANFNRGLPDGSAIDSEGFLWNCRYGGSCIVRISPDGEIDRIIEMPTKNITSCTFGGDHLKTLFVTTASEPQALGDRLMGGLFSIECHVPGLPENCFRLLDTMSMK